MKRTVSSFLWAALAMLAGTAALRAQTPTLTINPSRITNDYVGPITLSIGNLAPGAKVAISKYADFNGNGVIDPDDLMLQRWGVMDGVQSLIGGVRNSNVPDDRDGSTNGQIQVVLNCPSDNEVLDRVAGQYAFKVTDLSGNFATATFTVVQKAWPQSVSGTARDAGSGAPLTNAMVVMIIPNGNGGCGTFTDASGNYSLSNAPGSYALMAAKPGWISDQSAAMINLSSNSSMNLNLSASAATLYIAGQVTDQSNGKPLPGLFIQCESTNNLFTMAFTDTNGNYTAAVNPNQWKIRVDTDGGLTSKGYVQIDNGQSVNIGTTSQSNINFSFPKATALIYGQVLDNNSNGIANIRVQAQDSSYTERSTAQSRANGNYCLGVLNGIWTAQPDNDSLASQNLLGQSSDPLNLSAWQATNVNLQVIRVTSHLIGRVVDNHGNPQGNLGVVANQFTTNNTNPQNVYTETAPDGTFNLGVYGGQWNLALECEQSLERGLVSPQLQLNVTDGVDRTNITVTAQQATSTITVVITDSQGQPVNGNAFASLIPGWNYNSGCGTPNNGNSIQLGVFNGTWQVGLMGDMTSQGYDNPAQQTVTVNGNNPTIYFVLYPIGQTPARINVTEMNGQLEFFVTASSGHQYRLETCTNLNANVWTPITTNTAFGGGFWYSEPIDANAQARFYRTVLLQ